MLKFLLILFFIPSILVLLSCIGMIKNGKEGDMYKRTLNEIKDYCKNNEIDIDDDTISQEIFSMIKSFITITIVVMIIMAALLCLVFI